MSKKPVQKLLLVPIYLTLFCSLLIFFRVIQSGTTNKLFLFFNISLAWVPLICNLIIEKVKEKYLQIPIFILWFLFLPNALYLVSDLKHINNRLNQSLLWIDVILLFSVAILGILLSIISLELAREKIKKVWSKNTAILITIFTVLVSGIGLYLGRFPRLNSWHVFTNPIETTKIIVTELKTIYASQDAIIFIILFSITFCFYYFIYKNLVK